jgi:hypothetical protein
LLMTIFTYTETIGRQGAKIGQSMVFGWRRVFENSQSWYLFLMSIDLFIH